VPALAPRPDQIAVVVAQHPSGPVQMINLIKYRVHASYPAEYSGDASPECSGREAFQRFSAEALELLARVGARLVLLSKVDGVYLGEMAHDAWDDISVVEYPSVGSVNDLASDPAYQAAVVHRTAALERYAIVATTALFDASSTT
jgi:uncharacterized protein (DUF1330 family)